MKQHIVYTITKQTGGAADVKIVPETSPGVNGRTGITGGFRLFYMLPDNLANRSKEPDMDSYMSFVGKLTFLNENFFEWRYDGQILTETEIAQLVKIIQDHVEEWFEEEDNQPRLREEDLQDPESALYLSDEQLAAIMEHPLYDIAPYFLFGPADDLIGIVQNGEGFDIHINGTIAAYIKVPQLGGYQIVNGALSDPALTTEIVRRIRAIREL
ncbi:hypothetical protein [Mucilaginibacter gossypiicola]|nr:hypothetical protein [Mucilaginibacter gossypiicola]